MSQIIASTSGATVFAITSQVGPALPVSLGSHREWLKLESGFLLYPDTQDNLFILV